MQYAYIVFYQLPNYQERIEAIFTTLKGAQKHLDSLISNNPNDALYHIGIYPIRKSND